MTPDELRLLTDPSARNDPNFVRHVRSGMRRESRDRVFRTLRTISLVLGLVGVGMLGLSVVIALAGVGSELMRFGMDMRSFNVGALISAVAPALFMSIFGFVLAGVGMWTYVPSQALLTSGIQASASVVQVLGLSNGMTIKGSNMYATVSTVNVLLRVMMPNGAPYDVNHKERIISSDVGSLQVGATIPVRVSPSNPQKLLIDWNAIG